ncbi:hypothetical protein [Ruminiclostridium sufflavum]|uniref:hypothetical protein n=1 Tax=Ruminiclostridium sufflavum TaxID=396504 RepID=UPI000D7CF3A9|nr:hypothetical protein [Ruminiclostridium sufflavum]
MCRIEVFGGYLPVVTIVRDEAKTAGNCKTKQSHVTDPVAYLFHLSRLTIPKKKYTLAVQNFGLKTRLSADIIRFLADCSGKLIYRF